MTSFILRGLNPDQFAPLFDLDDATLAARQMQRQVADSASAYPCRVSLVDAAVGEEVLLVSYQHQPADSPYRASGPIFVRRRAPAAMLAENDVPASMLGRLISLRAYDAAHRIITAEVCPGTAVASWLQQAFDNIAVAYVHLHYARYGCFCCRAERAAAAADPGLRESAQKTE
jgi:hypothetical protein